MKKIELAFVCTLLTAATLHATVIPSNGPQTAPLAFENCPTAPVEFCDFTENSNEFWNATYWLNPLSGTPNILESEVDLQITATGAVSADLIQLHYELSLDLDGNGTPETVIKSKQLPGANKLGFNDNRAFDQRTVAVGDQYAFALQTAVVNGKRVASVRWNTANNPSVYVVPQLPYGMHSIKWIATDVSFNKIICVQTFVVKDCQKPTVECVGGWTTNIWPTGLTPNIWASDFLLYSLDNATPANQLKIGIRRSGTGTGFPMDGNGQPIANLSFTCLELGTQSVELWAIDNAGNADFCETNIFVKDNSGFCPNQTNPNAIVGYITTEELEPLESNTIYASYGAVATTQLGYYQFTPDSSITSFVITPIDDTDPLNGVTTYDLELIKRHIMNSEPLNTPFKIIAADANKSGSITSFDLILFRRVILGIYQELPDNDSWRFIERTQVFPDPSNPFSEVLRETITTSNPPVPGTNFDFFAIKIGDVNGSATANQLTGIEDRSFGTLSFGVLDRAFEANEVFEVAFQPSEQPLAQQFTLNFEGLELLEVIPGEGMTSEDFGIFPNAMTTASFDVAGSFSLRFRAITAGVLSQKMRLDGRITPAKAYNMQHQLLDIALRFEQETTTQTGQFVAQPNTPNPFSATTVITFELPVASEVQLSVYDALGRLVFEQKTDYAKGVQQIQLDARQLGAATGALFYELRTASGVATGKMMRL